MRKLSIALVLTTGVFLAPLPSAAAADTKHSLGLFVGYVSPTGDWTASDAGLTVTVELESTTCFGLAYQYRFSEGFSLGAGLLTAKHDVKGSVAGFGSATIGDTTFTPLLIDGNFHVLKNREKVDFYLGPTLGYAMWGDFKPNEAAASLDAPQSSIESSFIYGANFGLDVPLGEHWALNLGLRYLLASAKVEGEGEPPDIDVDPWIGTVGASYRF